MPITKFEIRTGNADCQRCAKALLAVPRDRVRLTCDSDPTHAWALLQEYADAGSDVGTFDVEVADELLPELEGCREWGGG